MCEFRSTITCYSSTKNDNDTNRSCMNLSSSCNIMDSSPLQDLDFSLRLRRLRLATLYKLNISVSFGGMVSSVVDHRNEQIIVSFVSTPTMEFTRLPIRTQPALIPDVTLLTVSTGAACFLLHVLAILLPFVLRRCDPHAVCS